jgi:hypothetical protein
MAFDNVTFFEVHLDGANVGPAAGVDEERADAEMDATMETEAVAGPRGRGRVAAVVALVAVAGVAAALRRRRGGESETDEEIEIEPVAETGSAATAER